MKMIKISKIDYFLMFRSPSYFGGVMAGALAGSFFPPSGIHVGALCGFLLALWLAWRLMPREQPSKLTDERLDEIRRFFWNYKYQENYDHAIYEMGCDLVQHIDEMKGGGNAY